MIVSYYTLIAICTSLAFFTVMIINKYFINWKYKVRRYESDEFIFLVIFIYIILAAIITCISAIFDIKYMWL